MQSALCVATVAVVAAAAVVAMLQDVAVAAV